jgi:hypothetical protein
MITMMKANFPPFTKGGIKGRWPAEGHSEEYGGDCRISGDGLAGVRSGVLGFRFWVFGFSLYENLCIRRKLFH